MNRQRLVALMRRGAAASIFLCLTACVSTSSDLASYTTADIRRPAQPFHVHYTVAFGSYGVGLISREQIDRVTKRVFDETKFFASATYGETKNGVTLTMQLESGYREHMWAIVVTGMTLLIVPAPITSYPHRLTAQLRRDDVLLGEFQYASTSRMWFGIVCLPAFLTGQTFRAGEGVLEDLLLNLLHDLSDPAVLQRLEASAQRAPAS